MDKAGLEKINIVQAEESFKTHVIRSTWVARNELYTPGLFYDRQGWIIQQPVGTGFTSIYTAEIITLGNKLFIHGDISEVLFSYTDANSPKEIVEWIATSGLRYVLEKSHEDPEYSTTVAKDTLREWIKEDHYSEAIDYITEAIEMLEGCWTLEEVKQYLYNSNAHIESEDLASLGEITPTKVIYAHVAIKKLWELIQQRENATSKD